MYMLCILTNYLSFVEVLASRTKTRFLASSAAAQRDKTSAYSSYANPLHALLAHASPRHTNRQAYKLSACIQGRSGLSSKVALVPLSHQPIAGGA